MSLWARFLPGRRIGTRLVAAVTLAMTVVLVGAGAFVYWRISFALDRQLDQDLRAYADITARQVRDGTALLTNSPGETAQVYTPDGALVSRSDAGVPRLASADRIAGVTGTARHTYDVGRMLPPSARVYRVSIFRSPSPTGDVVVVAAISRRKHDEALRELLGQLALTDAITVAAAGLVGYGVTRAALGPVERYRRAAASAGGDPMRRLPVDTTRDDELSRLGHTFNQLLGEIEESNARERQFLADASHELRSPLALLAAEIEWARHRPRAPEEMDEVLTSVGAQVARLVDLSNTLLDLEELYSAHTAEVAPVRVDDLVASALTGWTGQATAQDRALRVTASSDVVQVDARWLTLAIANLVGNALKHGTGTVTVTAEVTGAAGQEKLRLAVTDEGPGIPATLGARAFDRFTRADESRSTRGNGLGLALVKAVAEAHHGTAALVPGGVVIDLPARPPG
jgi:signal transduction histidine kinase